MRNPERVSIAWNDGKEDVVTDFQHFIPEDEIIERTEALGEQITGHAAEFAEQTS